MQLLGTVKSTNASLTVAVFDARSADAWVPTKAAENKAQFTGHPAEILRGLGKGEELTAIDVGPSNGVAFELEGKSGRLDVYRVDDGIVLVGPARSWFTDDMDDQFAALCAAREDASELAEIEVASGRLAIVYMWLGQVMQAKDAIGSFGDGGGLAVELAPGRYRILRHELDDLVAMFVLRT